MPWNHAPTWMIGGTMRRLAIFTFGALLSASAFSQDLLDGIDRDVLHGLLWMGEQETVISTAVPAEFSTLRLPRQFQWIGSAERSLGGIGGTSARSIIAAYRTTLAPEAAETTAIDALGGTPQPALGIGMGVFTSASLSLQKTVCVNDKSFSVIASAIDGVTYVVLQTQRGATGSVCDGRMRPSFPQNAWAGDLPKLDLPVDPASGKPAMLAGASSSGAGSAGGRSSTNAEFRLRDSAANVASHFARQMSAQGWEQDTAWSGNASAGSSWRKSRSGEPALVATLQVLAAGNDRITVSLSAGPRQ